MKDNGGKSITMEQGLFEPARTYPGRGSWHPLLRQIDIRTLVGHNNRLCRNHWSVRLDRLCDFRLAAELHLRIQVAGSRLVSSIDKRCAEITFHEWIFSIFVYLDLVAQSFKLLIYLSSFRIGKCHNYSSIHLFIS